MSEEKKEQERKPPEAGLVGCLSLFVAMAAFGFSLAYVSQHYNDIVMSGLLILTVGGVLYALIKHTETTLKVITFLILFGAIGGILSWCSDEAKYRPDDGPSRFHP